MIASEEILGIGSKVNICIWKEKKKEYTELASILRLTSQTFVHKILPGR